MQCAAETNSSATVRQSTKAFGGYYFYWAFHGRKHDEDWIMYCLFLGKKRNEKNRNENKYACNDTKRKG